MSPHGSGRPLRIARPQPCPACGRDDAVPPKSRSCSGLLPSSVAACSAPFSRFPLAASDRSPVRQSSALVACNEANAQLRRGQDRPVFCLRQDPPSGSSRQSCLHFLFVSSPEDAVRQWRWPPASLPEAVGSPCPE